MATVLTPNMSLPTPVVGQEPGPQYGEDNNACFNILDAHNHTPGNGVQITPDGLNINTTLPFNSNPATDLTYISYTAGSAPSVLRSTYVIGVDLYYKDGNGNSIQLTASGGVAGSNGSIANLVSPASASYVALTTKFVWQSDSNTAADMDGGSVIIRQKLANAKGITLSSPTSLAADYTVTLPAALPVSGTKFLTLDSTGAVADVRDVDNSTIEVSANLLQVKNLGITTAKIADGAVTLAKLVAPNVVGSSGTGATQTITSVGYTNVTGTSATITVTGRLVIFSFEPQDNTHPSYIASDTSSLSDPACIQLVYGSTTVLGQWVVGNGVFSPAMLNYVALPAAGTYTFKLQAKRSANATYVIFNYVVMNVFEI